MTHRLNEKTVSREADVAHTLEALADIAGNNLPAVESVRDLLRIIGSYAGWDAGRLIMRTGIVVDGQPEIAWRNPDREAHVSENITWDPRPIHHLLVDGDPIVVADIRNASELSSYFAGLPAAVRGYVAQPIRPGHVFVGTIEFFAGAPIKKQPETMGILAYGAAIISLLLERNRAQTRLRRSESRFQAIFNHSYQFISLLQTDGTFIDINDTALAFCGMPEDALLGHKYWDRAWWRDTPEERRRLQEFVARAANGELVRFETELDSRDGQVIVADFTIKPVVDANGEVVQLISEGRDITELKRTLLHLNVAEQRLEEAQRIAHIGHWDYDLVNNEATWSPTLVELWGLATAGVDSVSELLEHIHPEDIEGVREVLTLSIRTGRPYEHHFRIIRADGAVRTLYGAGRPMVDEHGAPRRLTGIIQDITGRRRLEESLANTVYRLSTLNKLVQSVASSLDQERIYREVLSVSRSLLNSDAVILFLHQGSDLVITAVDQRGQINLLGQRIPDEAGVAGEAWTTGETVWVSGDDCRRKRSPNLVASSSFEPASLLAVPVRWQDQMFGILEAADADEDAFSPDDIQLLQSIATWTAIAMGNARQHRSLERRLQESEAIAAVSRSLSETLEPQAILELIVRTANDIVPRSEWAIVHLLQGRPERLVPHAAAGVDKDLSDYVIGPNEGAAGLALSEGVLVNISDTVSDPRPSTYAHNIGLRSLLVAPVLTRSRALGTISLYASRVAAFTEDDERLLTILASQAALAIENAHLFDSQRRARMVAELQRERLKILTDRLVVAQEDERLRISRELHDEAGQALTSLKISLDLLRSELAMEQEPMRARLSDLSALTGKTMENLRALAHDLRPPGLDTFGLDVALEGLCRDFAARTGLSVTYSGEELPELPTAIALSLYRFTQEALTNIAKHAEAQTVSVQLRRENGALSLTIVDDGRGFAYEPDAKGQGVGLVSMQERLDLLNGVLDIHTAPGEGARLTARVPLDTTPVGADAWQE